MNILIGMELKCTKCKLEKSTSEFRERKQTKSGYQYWCRECERSAIREKYVPKPKREKRIVSEEERAIGAKKRMLHHRYKLTVEEYEQMYESQQHQCKICKEPNELGGMTGLVVDHCHTTLKVRGLLCRKCNNGLGIFKDDIEIFNNAIKYLTEDK